MCFGFPLQRGDFCQTLEKKSSRSRLRAEGYVIDLCVTLPQRNQNRMSLSCETQETLGYVRFPAFMNDFAKDGGSLYTHVTFVSNQQNFPRVVKKVCRYM